MGFTWVWLQKNHVGVYMHPCVLCVVCVHVPCVMCVHVPCVMCVHVPCVISVYIPNTPRVMAAQEDQGSLYPPADVGGEGHL